MLGEKDKTNVNSDGLYSWYGNSNFLGISLWVSLYQKEFIFWQLGEKI